MRVSFERLKPPGMGYYVTYQPEHTVEEAVSLHGVDWYQAQRVHDEILILCRVEEWQRAKLEEAFELWAIGKVVNGRGN